MEMLWTTHFLRLWAAKKRHMIRWVAGSREPVAISLNGPPFIRRNISLCAKIALSSYVVLHKEFCSLLEKQPPGFFFFCYYLSKEFGCLRRTDNDLSKQTARGGSIFFGNVGIFRFFKLIISLLK